MIVLCEFFIFIHFSVKLVPLLIRVSPKPLDDIGLFSSERTHNFQAIHSRIHPTILIACLGSLVFEETFLPTELDIAILQSCFRRQYIFFFFLAELHLSFLLLSKAFLHFLNFFFSNLFSGFPVEHGRLDVSFRLGRQMHRVSLAADHANSLNYVQQFFVSGFFLGMQGSEFFSKILASFPLLFDIDDIF